MTRDLQECTQIYTGSTFWHACSTGMPKSTPCVNLLFKKLLKAIMHSNCTLITLLYMYATLISFVLISVILTKLCCFKFGNLTVLTLRTTTYSYRKHVVRQMRKQYVEGIYINTVTLKSRFRVTKVTVNGTVG